MIYLAPERASLKETLVRAVNGVYLKANEKHIEIEMEPFEDIKICHDVKWTAEAFANVKMCIRDRKRGKAGGRKMSSM